MRSLKILLVCQQRIRRKKSANIQLDISSVFFYFKASFPIWSHLVVVVPALVLVYPPVTRPVAAQLFRVSDEAVVERHGGHHGLVQLGAAGAGAEGRVQGAQVVREEGLE